MNILQTLKDLLIRYISIDKNITTLEVAVAASDDNIDAMEDKLTALSNRVLSLENAAAKANDLQELEKRLTRLEDTYNSDKPQINEFASLKERLTKLESEQVANLREIRAATGELAAERKGLAADAREIIAQIQANPPQLPPTNPTDN